MSRRFAMLAALTVVCAGVELVAGRGMSPAVVWDVLGGGGDTTERHILLQLRLPRLLVALGAGACLGVAGLVLQSALRNPLAGPEVTGVTPGAVLGAVAATGFGLAGWESPLSVVVAACVGGCAGAALLWLLGGVSKVPHSTHGARHAPPLPQGRGRCPHSPHRPKAQVRPVRGLSAGTPRARTGHRGHRTGLLKHPLAGRGRSDPAQTAVHGVLVSAVLGGLTAMVLLVAPGELGSVVQWLVGTTEGRVWQHWHLLWPWALAWGAAAWLMVGPLTLLRCGDDIALAAGLSARRARTLALLCAVALTAGAVAAVGALGFVGLLVPHLAVAVFGADLRVTLPGAALVGAAVVCGADAAAQLSSRLLAVALDSGRLTLPVGALTACLGAVLLLVVVRRAPNRTF